MDFPDTPWLLLDHEYFILSSTALLAPSGSFFGMEYNLKRGYIYGAYEGLRLYWG